MASGNDHTLRIGVLAAGQHGVVHRHQLRSIGLTDPAIRHRVARGDLHPRWPGVYAVGRADLSREGEWMAAVLTCAAGAALGAAVLTRAPGAALSHQSGAVLWRFSRLELAEIEVSVPIARSCKRTGIVVHRRRCLAPGDVVLHNGIPVTSPLRTLVDLAARFEPGPLEAAVNEAIRLRLTSVRRLRGALASRRHQPGARALRALLDRRSFRLTDSELERLFMPLAGAAGLPRPQTQERVNACKVDFWWADLGLVVETDGGDFHFSAAQQTEDRRRDQAHTAAGLTQLRFTHAQVAHDPSHVVRVLARVAERLRSGRR